MRSFFIKVIKYLVFLEGLFHHKISILTFWGCVLVYIYEVIAFPNEPHTMQIRLGLGFRLIPVVLCWCVAFGAYLQYLWQERQFDRLGLLLLILPIATVIIVVQILRFFGLL